MTEEQVKEIIGNLKWIRLTLALIAGILLAQAAHAQAGPIIRNGNVLHIYVGNTSTPGTDWRVIVDTTWSVSPNADIGAPFEEVGENPAKWYWAKEVRTVAPDDPCLAQPELALPCRDAGWVSIPVPDVKIEVPYGSGNWVFDKDMRLIIHTVNVAEFGLCSVTVCGAKLVVPRIKWIDILTVPKQRVVRK